MIPVLLALGGMGALVAWHMQRRPLPPLALSFARLLPDPPPATRRERRFALALPVRSLGFWLRMAVMLVSLAAIAAIWLSLRGLPVPGLALRIVVDTSHSMGIGSEGGRRIDLARKLVEDALAQAAMTGDLVCAELTAVGAAASAPVRVVDGMPETPVRSEGAPVSVLVAAALAGAGDCAPTHVLVVTDHPPPPGLPPVTEAGAVLMWQQVGEPAANAGIQAVTLAQAGLGGTEGRLMVELALHGDAPTPRLRVTGPDFAAEVVARASSSRIGTWTADIPVTAAGQYRIDLIDPDAYTGDDRMLVEIGAVGQATVDWRLPDYSRPSVLRAEPGSGLLVMPLAETTASDLDRPVLLTYPGWPNPTSLGARIGSFLADPAFLPALNLDVLEAALPQPPGQALPPGFVPIMVTEPGSLAILARRADPPGLIVPHPRGDLGSPVQELSTVMFLSALSDLLDGGSLSPPQRWEGPEGPVAMAGLESATARALIEAPEPHFEVAPAEGSVEGELFPLLALLGLLFMATERLHAAWATIRRRGDAV